MPIQLAVVMRRDRIDHPWQMHRWALDEVLLDVGQFERSLPNGLPRIDIDDIHGQCVLKDADNERWIYTGFKLDLFVDEAEGYYLNVNAPKPCWFVMWRQEEMDSFEEICAIPRRVVLSYNEAGRMSDGGETVDTYPVDATILQWMKDFVDQHYKPEPKRKHRPMSFEGAHRPASKGGSRHE
jgi:hypothetical protein